MCRGNPVDPSQESHQEANRRLGVSVKRIVLRDGDETREIPMDHPDIF
jgi:hypothetical protein